MNKRELYYRLRHEYRHARREDAQWRPDPYAARNTRQARPDTAGAILRPLSPRMTLAVMARPATIQSVPKGPRARWYINWAPTMGRYAGLSLYKRVALRSGLRQIKAYELGLRELAYTDSTPLFEVTLRLECQNLRRMADAARHRYANGG